MASCQCPLVLSCLMTLQLGRTTSLSLRALCNWSSIRCVSWLWNGCKLCSWRAPPERSWFIICERGFRRIFLLLNRIHHFSLCGFAAILLTHGHSDHYGECRPGFPSALIYGLSEEVPVLDGTAKQGAPWLLYRSLFRGGNMDAGLNVWCSHPFPVTNLSCFLRHSATSFFTWWWHCYNWKCSCQCLCCSWCCSWCNKFISNHFYSMVHSLDRRLSSLFSHLAVLSIPFFLFCWRYFADSTSQAQQSLRHLTHRLETRSKEVKWLVFSRSGPLQGFQPLLVESGISSQPTCGAWPVKQSFLLDRFRHSNNFSAMSCLSLFLYFLFADFINGQNQSISLPFVFSSLSASSS